MYEFVSESFRIENTFEYILSIQVSLNGFSFSILQQSDQKQVVYVKCLPLKISNEKLIARRFKDWYEAEELLQKPYKQVKVCILNKTFTLIPSKLSDANTKDQIPSLLFKDAHLMEFAENVIESPSSKLYFAIPTGLNETIQNTLGECHITHPVKHLCKLSSIQDGTDIKLLLNNRDLLVLVHQNGSLLFCNAFEVNHNNDVVFYLLSICKQLDVNTKDTPLYWAGLSNFNKELDLLLNKYFASVKTIDKVLSRDYSIVEDNIINENISLFLD